MVWSVVACLIVVRGSMIKSHHNGCFDIPLNVTKSMANISLASHMEIPSRLSAWQGKMEPIKDHVSTCGCLTGLISQELFVVIHLDSYSICI